jgi:hypothetical protein
MIYVEE